MTLNLSELAFLGSLNRGSSSNAGAFNPVFWYDFADTAVVTTSVGKVDAIADKGSAARNLTASATKFDYVDGINGLKCADLGAAGHQRFLRNTVTSGGSNVAELYFVLDGNMGASFGGFYGLFTGFESLGSGTIANNATAGLLTSLNFNTAFINNSVSNQISSVLPAINSPCVLRVVATGGTPRAINGVTLGNDRNNEASNRGWGGLIGEVAGFGAQLSSPDRAAFLGDLYSKWGITP